MRISDWSSDVCSSDLTGLGPSGELSHLCSFAPGSAPYERVFDWMGEAARSSFAATFVVTNGETPSYRGLFSTCLPDTAPQSKWTWLLIELASYHNHTVCTAVLMVRWHKFGRSPSDVPSEGMYSTMMEAPAPSNHEWRADRKG